MSNKSLEQTVLLTRNLDKVVFGDKSVPVLSQGIESRIVILVLSICPLIDNPTISSGIKDARLSPSAHVRAHRVDLLTTKNFSRMSH